jgi:A49-like RNA polymerase I associated factor
MITTVVREQLKSFYAYAFEKLASNQEKKFAIRAFIYLDCLVAFYRLPTHIESTPEELAAKLNNQHVIAEHLLTNFT